MKNIIKHFLLWIMALSVLPASAGRKGDRFTYDGVTYEITNVPPKTADGSFYGNLEVGIVTTTRTGDVTFESVVTDSVGATFYVTSVMSRGLNGLSGLTSVTFAEGLKWLEFHTFRYCDNLTSITLPSTVTYVDSHCCNDCPKFKGFTVSVSNEAYSATDGVLFHDNGEGKKSIVVYPDAKTETSYDIPEGTTSVGDYTFDRNAALKSLTIPSTLTTIPNGAYFICKLEEFKVASGNTAFTAEDGILYTADKTKIIAVPVEKTGNLTVASAVTEIKGAAFKSSKLTTVDLSNCDGLTEIANDAFRGMPNLTSISLPKNVASIPGDFTRESACEAIYIAAGNTTYKDVDGVVFTIDGTKLVSYPPRKNGTGESPTKAYTVPEGTVEIGSRSFFESCLETVSLPASLTSIGGSAFQWNYDLKTVKVADNSQLTTIGGNAFWSCTALETIDLSNCPITTVGSAAFEKCSALTKAVIATAELDKIESLAFNECENLTDVGDLSITNITSVGERAFNNVPLATINFPATLKTIGPSAFSKDSNYDVLTKVTFAGNAVESIGENAFQNNKKLEEIDLSRFTSLTTIGNQAFSGCEQFLQVTIPASVTKLGSQAFLFCRNLKSITVEAANANYRDINGMLLTKNGKKLLAYPGGKTFTSFDFQTNDERTSNYVMLPPVEEIGDSVFYCVYTVRDLKVPATVKKIGSLTFYRTLNLRYLSMMGDKLPEGYSTCVIKVRDDDPDHAGEKLGDTREATLIVRKRLYATYNGASNWKNSAKYAFDKVLTSFYAAAPEYFPWTENSESKLVAPGYDPDIVVKTNSELGNSDDDMTAGAKRGWLMAPRRAAASVGFMDGSENDWYFTKVVLVGFDPDREASVKTAIIPDEIAGDIGMEGQSGTTYSVRGVAENTFANVPSLEHITFFANMEYIGSNSFKSGASGLNVYFVNLGSGEDFKPLAVTDGNFGSDVGYTVEFGDEQHVYVKKSVYDTDADDSACPAVRTITTAAVGYKIPLAMNASNYEDYTTASFCREFDTDFHIDGNSEKVLPFRMTSYREFEGMDGFTGYITGYSIDDQLVPAGTGVIIRAPKGTGTTWYSIKEQQGMDMLEATNTGMGSYGYMTITPTSYTTLEVECNGTPTTPATVSDRCIMTWSKKGKFVLTSGGTLPAFKSFVSLPSTAFAAKAIVCSFFEEATGIGNVTGEPSSAGGASYDLQGRRMANIPTTLPTGIYIQNGKKMVKGGKSHE